jgi:hypothetical protein
LTNVYGAILLVTILNLSAIYQSDFYDRQYINISKIDTIFSINEYDMILIELSYTYRIIIAM